MRIARFVLAILFASAWAVAQTSSGPVGVGINLMGNYDWSRQYVFADAMRNSRGWGSVLAPWDLAAPVDADGWPTADAGVIVLTNGVNIGGTYHLSFRGRATVAPRASSLTLQNVVYDALTDTTRADVVVESTARQIVLTFTGTRGGVRNVRLMRPGYVNETFTRPILDLLRPFAYIRTMDWMSTSGHTHPGYGNNVSRWSERTLPRHATQSRLVGGVRAGVAWEFAAELANTLDKDIWVNVPDLADDDYVRSMATLLRDRLEPGRGLYLEFSNEVWNPAFESYYRNLAAAEAEVLAGGSNLNADGDTNHEHWAHRRTARRTREIAEVFRSVFGAAAMGSRVRPLLCGHFFVTETVTQGLDFLERTYGPARGLIYAIGCGQYDTPSRESSRRTDLTVEEIVAEWTTNLEGMRRWAQAYAGIARTYGVRFLAYEGGVCCVGAESVDAKAAANRDPRVRGLVSSLVGNFLAEGGDSFCYFAAASPYDRTGMYGLTEDITVLDTPKTRGIADVLARLRK